MTRKTYPSDHHARIIGYIFDCARTMGFYAEDENMAEGSPERSNSYLEFTLPLDGIYDIEVSSYIGETSGEYTLTIESDGTISPTPSPTMTASLTQTS